MLTFFILQLLPGFLVVIRNNAKSCKIVGEGQWASGVSRHIKKAKKAAINPKKLN